MVDATPTPPISPPLSPPALPAELEQRRSYWHGLWRRSAAYHYLFGVVSVAASVISTSLEGQNAKYFSIIAAIATAMIGFIHPERRYIKFARAWRVLDVAAIRYSHGLIGLPAVIDALEKGEQLIADFEDKYDGSSEAPQPQEIPAQQPPTQEPPAPPTDKPQ